ncbi:alpha/beta hydrolase [Methylopila henanensis]|uniref:Alpha/beta hydrolase n=1 Tax=Methylopila henanensis TaxID=873516 RepID=A0ABW4KDD4_9HYPH
MAGAKWAKWAALALVLGLAGCAGRAEGVLVPSAAEAPGASRVDLMVATTRKSTVQPGVLFSGERGTRLALTQISVSIPPDAARKAGEVQWPRRLPADPSKEFSTVAARQMDREQARAWFRSETTGRKKHVLLFVHGFNNGYEDAVYRFAQIVHDSGTDAVPVLFTWPSRGSLFAYNYDRESTNYSRDALEEVLQNLAAAPEVKDVSVLAHSMGSFLAMESLRQMAIRDGRIAPKIRNVILAAPDVDVDVFKQQLGEMGAPGRRPRFTVFVSRDDTALRVSSRIAGQVPRLGAIDPKAEPYRSEFETQKIDAFDLTDLRTADPLAHGKFAASPQVVKAIGGRLVAGQEISANELSLGERVGQAAAGAAATAGSAAGAIVTAPIAIVDPASRRNYGDRLNDVRGNVGGTFDSLR